MFLTNELEFNLVSSEIDLIYNGNIDELILHHIKNHYEKTCYKNQYIFSINKIIKRSNINIIRRDLDCKVRIFVVIEATVIKYDELDTITTMKISQIIKKGKISMIDMLECKNDHALALLPLNESMVEYKVGDVIPIKIGKMTYKIGRHHISISAYPFLPHQVNNIIYQIDSLTSEEKSYLLKNIIPIYNNIMEKKNDLYKSKEFKIRFDYFTELIYPYVKDKSKEIKSRNIKNLFDLETSGYIKLSNEIPLTELKIITVDSVDDSINLITDKAINVYQKLIFNACKELNTIINLSNDYLDPVIFNSHTYLFEHYKNLKFK